MPSSVCAQITATSAIEPLVIHIFEPLRTQPSPSRFADVRMWFGSLPKSASVRPKHPITSPVAIFGSHCCFCSLGAVLPDREHAERPLNAHERTEPRIARLELQAREAVRDGVRAETPVALEVHAQQPEPAELEGDVLGERAGLEPPVDTPGGRCPRPTRAPDRAPAAPPWRADGRCRGNRADRVPSWAGSLTRRPDVKRRPWPADGGTWGRRHTTGGTDRAGASRLPCWCCRCSLPPAPSPEPSYAADRRGAPAGTPAGHPGRDSASLGRGAPATGPLAGVGRGHRQPRARSSPGAARGVPAPTGRCAGAGAGRAGPAERSCTSSLHDVGTGRLRRIPAGGRLLLRPHGPHDHARQRPTGGRRAQRRGAGRSGADGVGAGDA